MKRTIKSSHAGLSPRRRINKYIFQNFWLYSCPNTTSVHWLGPRNVPQVLTASNFALQVRIITFNCLTRRIIGASSRLWHGSILALSWENKKQATSPRAHVNCELYLHKISCSGVCLERLPSNTNYPLQHKQPFTARLCGMHQRYGVCCVHVLFYEVCGVRVLWHSQWRATASPSCTSFQYSLIT